MLQSQDAPPQACANIALTLTMAVCAESAAKIVGSEQTGSGAPPRFACGDLPKRESELSPVPTAGIDIRLIHSGRDCRMPVACLIICANPS